MITKSHIGAKVEGSLICHPGYKQRFLAESIWDVEHWRKGKLLGVTRDHNVCTAEGLNKLLDVMFHAATQITTWYILLFNTDTTPADGTTYATPVFTESEAYDEATRQEYVEAAAGSKSITNSANKATFTMDATTTIYGAALVGGGTDANVKSDAAGGGTMYCASKFSSAKSVEDDDILRITVTITASDA